MVFSSVKRTCSLFGIAVFGTCILQAQELNIFVPSFGVEAGVPLTEMFSTYSITALDYPGRYTPYSYAVPRYELGAYADFHLTQHWGFEVEGLYRDGQFAFEQPVNEFYEHTHFNAFQFPLMIQCRFTTGHVRPFVETGASLRHLTGVHTSFLTPAGYQDLGVANRLMCCGTGVRVAESRASALHSKKGQLTLGPKSVTRVGGIKPSERMS